jgi:ABC-type multidrug transport system ATPase subunit
MVGRTTFIIAHRLSTVRKADRIAVLSGGRIMEIGSHQELLDSKGYYSGSRLRGVHSGGGRAWSVGHGDEGTYDLRLKRAISSTAFLAIRLKIAIR